MPSNRRCVLKQLKPVHSDTPELRQLVQDRFQREAATLEMLGEAHLQIPRLYAYFLEDGRFYLVQEWIDGLTIAQKVQQAGIQSEQAVKAMIARVLGAIALIHSKGIVHRDIKPDNIILRSHDSEPVLIDFGAVKETMNTVISSQGHSTHSIVVGTPGYMPVEQLAGRPVYSSDIYSLGMTAIYMLTGKSPQEIVSDPASGQLLWREHAADVSDRFADFLETAIHTHAQSRFPTVQKMASDLSLLATNAAPTQISLPSDDYTQKPQLTQQPQLEPIAASQPPPSTIKTVAVAPAHTPDLRTQTDYSTPVQSAHSPNSSTRNAFIIGGILGLSILAGSVVVVKGLPKSTEASVDSSTSTPTTTATEVEAPLPPSSADPVPSPAMPSLDVEPAPVTAPEPFPVTPSPTTDAPVADSDISELPWKFVGTASSGESVSVNTNSILPSGNSVDFEYKIGDELIVASADCRENRWYTENYGWYSPQSEATQSMLNFVCQ